MGIKVMKRKGETASLLGSLVINKVEKKGYEANKREHNEMKILIVSWKTVWCVSMQIGKRSKDIRIDFKRCNKIEMVLYRILFTGGKKQPTIGCLLPWGYQARRQRYGCR